MDDLKRRSEIDVFQYEELTADRCLMICGGFFAFALCLDLARFMGWL